MAPLTIGLTGGIAAGKSEALAAFERLGAATLSSDAVVHELLDSEPLLGRLAERWGAEVAPDGRVDRARVGEIVFADPEQLPGSSPRSTRWSASGSAAWLASLPAETEVAVVEVPLLFESGMEGVFDTTVAVVTADEVRRERAEARGHALVDEREARQLDQDEKAERADHVVENDGTIEDLERALSALVAEAAAMKAKASGAGAGSRSAPSRSLRSGVVAGVAARRRRHVRPGDPGADPAAAPRGHHPPAGRGEGRRRRR